MNRRHVVACDHDFAPEAELKLFGILLPASDDVWFYFTDSVVTADFIADRLDDLWPELRRRFRPHTLALNMDILSTGTNCAVINPSFAPLSS